MIEISVIVPVYNAGKKLYKCIESILNQTFKEFEIILVNDGSTDNSLSICKEYALKDSRVKVINQNNKGSIISRKIGVVNSNADYIMFVDADDWVNKHILEYTYKEIIENNCDIVVANICKVLGDRKIIKKTNNDLYFKDENIYEGEDVKNKLAKAYLHGHPFPAGLVCKLYKKEFLENSGKYVERIKFLGEDLFLNLEIFTKVKKVKVINKTLYYYRIGGFTSKYMPYHFDDIIIGYEIQKEIIDEYFINTREDELNGISIMLLNSFKTTLYNLLNSEYDKFEILKKIEEYITNKNILEALENDGSKRYFEKEYLDAINSKNIEYLYKLGSYLYKKTRGKRIIKKILSITNIF